MLPVLRALGLIESDQWAAAAEPVLWRKALPEWDLDITADPRFWQALDRTVNAIPADIRAEITRLVTITEAT